jgi:hypothetical protein
MMRRIISAGLPSNVSSFLARQLEDVSVLMTFAGDDALTEMRERGCSLLLLDSGVPGLPAESVLGALREDGVFDTLPVVYCLAESDRSTQEASRQRLLREFPEVRVMLHPLSLADVSRVATTLLAPRPAAATAVTQELHISRVASQRAGAAHSQSPRAFPFRRAS